MSFFQDIFIPPPPPPPLGVINVLSLNNNTIIFVFAHSGPLVCGKFKCDCKQTINIWSSLVTSVLSGELIRKKNLLFSIFHPKPRNDEPDLYLKFRLFHSESETDARILKAHSHSMSGGSI